MLVLLPHRYAAKSDGRTPTEMLTVWFRGAPVARYRPFGRMAWLTSGGSLSVGRPSAFRRCKRQTCAGGDHHGLFWRLSGGGSGLLSSGNHRSFRDLGAKKGVAGHRETLGSVGGIVRPLAAFGLSVAFGGSRGKGGSGQNIVRPSAFSHIVRLLGFSGVVAALADIGRLREGRRLRETFGAFGALRV